MKYIGDALVCLGIAIMMRGFYLYGWSRGYNDASASFAHYVEETERLHRAKPAVTAGRAG